MDKDWADFLKKDYLQGFPAYCGFEVLRVDEGEFETRLKLRSEHLQQDGLAHAGVMATMADHTAGYAAFTVVSTEQRILTIEFKINFLKPAKGQHLICRAGLISTGKKVIVAESAVFSVSGDNEKLVAKYVGTMMVTPASSLANKS